MSSKSSSRSKYSHFFIGSSTSVLKDEFVLAFQTQEQFDIKSWLPFSGKMKLPTQMEVLKLILFLKDEGGRKNKSARPEDIYKSVTEVVEKYWAKAGFITKSRIERDVENLHLQYKQLLKNQSKTTPSFIKAREDFLMSIHIISAVLKTAKKDGESLDLNEVTLSESTIRRGRQKAREEICRQQYKEFQANMPEYLAVHWDGKMMKEYQMSAH